MPLIKSDAHISLEVVFRDAPCSDVSFLCGSLKTVTKSNRCLLVTHSEVLDVLLQSGDFKETVTHIVELPEHVADVVSNMLEFLITGADLC